MVPHLGHLSLLSNWIEWHAWHSCWLLNKMRRLWWDLKWLVEFLAYLVKLLALVLKLVKIHFLHLIKVWASQRRATCGIIIQVRWKWLTSFQLWLPNATHRPCFFTPSGLFLKRLHNRSLWRYPNLTWRKFLGQTQQRSLFSLFFLLLLLYSLDGLLVNCLLCRIFLWFRGNLWFFISSNRVVFVGADLELHQVNLLLQKFFVKCGNRLLLTCIYFWNLLLKAALKHLILVYALFEEVFVHFA